MSLMVGKIAPDFSLEGTSGTFSSADLKGNWAIVFFFPKAKTSVCQSEVLAFNQHFNEFASLGTQIVGISVDDIDTLTSWVQELGSFNYPLLSDKDHVVSKAFEVFSERDKISYRGLFILDPEGKIRYQVVQEPFFGRSIEEVKRILQALQSGGPCPVDWKPEG